MDVLELFRMVAGLFIKFWSIELQVGQYTITVGAVVIFCGIVGLIISFLKGVAD